MDWYSLSKIAPMSYIRDHPYLPWDREGLSRNKGITLSDIEYLDREGIHLQDEWCWIELSGIVPILDIRSNPDLSWYKGGLSYNPGITLDDVLYLGLLPMDEDDWDWERLSEVLPIQEVISNPGLSWDKDGLSYNPGITLGIIQYLDGYLRQDDDWDWDELSQSIPMSDIIKAIEDDTFPGAMWNRWAMSRNTTLTMDTIRRIDQILDHIGHPVWSWESMAKRIPIPNILVYAEHLWRSGIYVGWYKLSQVAPIPYVRDHLGMLWDRQGLSRNKGITLSDIEYLDREGTYLDGWWDWSYLHRVLPIWNLIHRKDIPLSRSSLSHNKEITLDIIPYIDRLISDIKDKWGINALARTLPISDILDNIGKGTYRDITWPRLDLSRNPGLTMEDIKEIDRIGGNRVYGNWDWEAIAKRIPISDILAYAISQM